MPNLSNKPIKLKIGLRTALSLLLVLVFILEAYLAYESWYSNLQAAPAPVSQGRVVRVNLTGYRNIIQMLDGMEAFTPDTRAQDLGTPFRFRE
jgi:hypothetical protein